jgi:Right handed beta helix region
MRRTFYFFVFFAFAICFCALTSQAQAQATRTWVSGTGDDANPCSRTAPCKTFAGAISKTADCGEIDALDPAGYGTITITKGIKIDGGGGEAGQVASILASGVPGVTINNTSAACTMDVLRNLDINGIQSGTIGVNVVAGGTLGIQNVDIENFTQQCVNLKPSTAVGFNAYNSNFERCAGGGIVVQAASGTERAVIVDSKITKMTSTGIGVSAAGTARVSVFNTDISQNGGGGVQSSGSTSFVQLQHCNITNNQIFGVHATGGGTVTMADNTVAYNNGTGLLADVGSSIATWNNNWVTNNSPDGSRTGTIPPQ